MNAATNRGWITLSVMLATIMQTLDTTIANVALPHMQGALKATQEQVSWVLTSYIIACAIMTAPTGILATKLGRKRLFMIGVGGFTVTSVLCGAAQSLEAMILFRLLQGICCAVLVPLSQAVLLDTYPREKHGSAMSMWGVGIMLGPILGPSLGGWLTEFYSWRWVFYINLPIVLFTLFGIYSFMQETEIDGNRKLDGFGFTLLALAIMSLQLLLDRGQGLDWFNSNEILLESVIAGLALYLFLVHIKTSSQPFIDPAMFGDRNFSISLVFAFVIGIIMLASMALLPPFLQTLMGYPVIDTGLILAPRGLGTMLAMQIAGRLIHRWDMRIFLLAGLLLTSFSLWEMSQFTVDVRASLIIQNGMIQGFGLGFIFVPISTLAYSTLAAQYRYDATDLFSLLRNIGSSVGISIVVTMLARNTQINHAEIVSRITNYGAGNNMLGAVMDEMGNLGIGNTLQALNKMVTEQALTIAYLNDFRLMTVIVLMIIPLVLLLRTSPIEARS